MKIAVVMFPNSKMGGILTFHRNLVAGLRRLGHDVTDFYLSDNTSQIRAPLDQTGTSRYCGGRALGIRAAFVAGTVSTLSGFDAVAYDSPAPSLNRSFDDPAWQGLYRGLRAAGVRQVAAWHDPFWDRYYPWVRGVLEYIDVVAAVQAKAYDSLPPELLPRAFVCNHPLDLTGTTEAACEKQDLVVCPHQFKSWKRIDLFVRAAPAVLADGVAAEVYNVGVEYYYMAGSVAKRKPRYRLPDGRWIWDVAVGAGLDYRGTVGQDEIVSAFRRQKCTIDVSVGELGSKKGDGYRSLNYSVLECMKYGGTPVVRRHSVLPPFTSDSFLVCNEGAGLVDSIAENVVRAVRGWGAPAAAARRAANRDLLRRHYSAPAVARSIVDRL